MHQLSSSSQLSTTNSFTILKFVGLLVVVATASPQSAAAQYPGLGCTWSSPTIPVRYNAGTAAANGFNATRFHDELIDAGAIWNEEAMAAYDLTFGATTSATSESPGVATVVNQNLWSCMDNTSAKAFGPGAGASCGSTGTIIRMIMQDSCNPGTPRQWKTGWPGSTYHSFGLSGAVGYEFVATHELGHTLGLPVPSPDQVSWSLLVGTQAIGICIPTTEILSKYSRAAHPGR